MLYTVNMGQYFWDKKFLGYQEKDIKIHDKVHGFEKSCKLPQQFRLKEKTNFQSDS